MNFRLDDQKTILKGFFNVVEQKFTDLKSGEQFQRMCVVSKEASAILLYLEEEDKIIMGKQYRTPFAGTGTDPHFLEIPAGVIDEGESAEQSVKRESKEETGYQVDQVELIHVIHTSPGYTTEKLNIYFGKITSSDKKEEGGGRDKHEEITIREVLFEEAWQMLESGEITDAKTIIALQWLKNKRSKK